MLKIQNLNFKFDEKVIFDNAELEIPKGKISIIMGANGAGKSTLLKIITNNMKADCSIIKEFKETFYLPQNPYYPYGVSVFDYVSSVFYKKNWKWFLSKAEESKVNEALKMVELFNQKDMEIQKLSAGEFQKANFALGLLSGADLFLLDEPLSNMDLINQIKTLENLTNLVKSGVTSVLIMHDINIAANFGDYFIGINKDHKIVSGSKEEFFKPQNLNDIYNIDFRIMNDDDKIFVQIVD